MSNQKTYENQKAFLIFILGWMGRHLTCSSAISCFLSVSPHHTSRLCDVVKLIGNCINTCDQKTPRARLRAKLLATSLCARGAFRFAKAGSATPGGAGLDAMLIAGRGMASKNCTLSKGVTRIFSRRHVHSVHNFSPGGTVSRNIVHNAHTDLCRGSFACSTQWPQNHGVQFSDWKTKLLANHHKGTL
jgi:hypothetical protein